MWIFIAFILSVGGIGYAYWKDYQNDKKEFKMSLRIVLRNTIILIFCIGIMELLKLLFKKF